MPPEHSSAEREIDHLSKEIAQLKKREPQFRIRCTDHDDNEVAEINLVHNKYEPLTRRGCFVMRCYLGKTDSQSSLSLIDGHLNPPDR